MAVCLPLDWPPDVRPPGSDDFEASAVAFPVKFFCSTLCMSLCLFGVGVRLCDVGAPA
jgi:hypothetical protein